MRTALARTPTPLNALPVTAVYLRVRGRLSVTRLSPASLEMGGAAMDGRRRGFPVHPPTLGSREVGITVTLYQHAVTHSVIQVVGVTPGVLIQGYLWMEDHPL
jgi:hypothetical protein